MAIQDNNKTSYIVAAAILAYERLELIDTVFKFFKQENQKNLHITKSIMIDKDLKEDKVLKTNFPDARILFFFWHVQKIFSRTIKNSNLENLLGKMMYSKSLEEYYELYGKFNYIFPLNRLFY